MNTFLYAYTVIGAVTLGLAAAWLFLCVCELAARCTRAVYQHMQSGADRAVSRPQAVRASTEVLCVLHAARRNKGITS